MIIRKILIYLVSVCFLSFGAEAETFREGEKAYQIGNVRKAFDIWSELAAKNDPASQYYLGTLYMMHDIPADEIKELLSENKSPIKEGMKLIEKSAENGYPDGLGMVASFYERGFEGYEKSAEKGLIFRKRAADTGDPMAEYNYGYSLMQNGYEANEKEIVKYMNSSAKNDFVMAQFFLGALHLSKIKEESLITAYAWFLNVKNWKPNKDVQGVSPQISQIIEGAETQLKELAKRLSPESIMEARNLSEKLLKK